MKRFDVAVVGATGAVGGEMVRILESRHFPVGRLYPLASSRSAGKCVDFCGESMAVEDLAAFDFSKVRLALFSAGGATSAEYAPRATAAGCVVVDNSSQFRYEEDVPLVVPEVNPEAIGQYAKRGIVANPNCSTIQMLVAVKPLHDEATVRRITVSTYQAVAGSGNRAIEELATLSAKRLSGSEDVRPEVYPVPIAFNAIPHIDVFQANGYTREEMKMVWETRKILSEPMIEVNPTAVRVPVFFGHSEAIHLAMERPLTAERAREILAGCEGVCVIDEHADGGYPTASEQAAGNDEVFVGRIRGDLDSPNGLNLWVVSDSVRKGGALNAVQIAEHLAARYL